MDFKNEILKEAKKNKVIFENIAGEVINHMLTNGLNKDKELWKSIHACCNAVDIMERLIIILEEGEENVTCD